MSVKSYTLTLSPEDRAAVLAAHHSVIEASVAEENLLRTIVSKVLPVASPNEPQDALTNLWLSAEPNGDVAVHCIEK